MSRIIISRGWASYTMSRKKILSSKLHSCSSTYTTEKLALYFRKYIMCPIHASSNNEVSIMETELKLSEKSVRRERNEKLRIIVISHQWTIVFALLLLLPAFYCTSATLLNYRLFELKKLSIYLSKHYTILQKLIIHLKIGFNYIKIIAQTIKYRAYRNFFFLPLHIYTHHTHTDFARDGKLLKNSKVAAAHTPPDALLMSSATLCNP